ncbi:MAG: DUF2282 domain-containing protein [Cocleimonas sp.]|nr:DUF2282 domain-containing protein [Cocleimonas sp.]
MANSTKTLIKAALSTALILGFAQSASALKTQEELEVTKKAEATAGREKCAGRILAGLNDCPTSMHACAGMADEDGDKEEFIWMPKGSCEKIIGTHVIKDKKKEKEIVIKNNEKNKPKKSS